jgi:hypothetical protein
LPPVEEVADPDDEPKPGLFVKKSTSEFDDAGTLMFSPVFPVPDDDDDDDDDNDVDIEGAAVEEVAEVKAESALVSFSTPLLLFAALSTSSSRSVDVALRRLRLADEEDEEEDDGNGGGFGEPLDATSTRVSASSPLDRDIFCCCDEPDDAVGILIRERGDPI